MDTDSIWKFMRSNTIREYCDRTPLPAPLCLISHFYLLLQQCSSKCCKQRSNQINSLSKSDKVIQLKYDFEVISVFGILIFFFFLACFDPYSISIYGIPVFLCKIQQE